MLCVTCHKTPINDNGDVKTFPVTFRQFGLKSFSHRDHLNPAKMKNEKLPSCAFCHQFDATGNRASYPSHPQCYSCHEHQADSKKGTCGTCHTAADESLKYASLSGRATKEYKFFHGNHFKVSSIQKVCTRCHSLNQDATPTQVDVVQFEPVRDNIAHNSSCWQNGCHVSAKELACAKCHVTPPVKIQIGT
ncbi:MAG: hypothetical protein C5B54_10830 [Acidobacteria bacterium]|nr:MAG: hypothetical protein C5B54_10830 [Acidobacteriota bacterium]